MIPWFGVQGLGLGMGSTTAEPLYIKSIEQLGRGFRRFSNQGSATTTPLLSPQRPEFDIHRGICPDVDVLGAV